MRKEFLIYLLEYFLKDNYFKKLLYLRYSNFGVNCIDYIKLDKSCIEAILYNSVDLIRSKV